MLRSDRTVSQCRGDDCGFVGPGEEASSATVLLVDDNFELLLVLRRVLEETGYRVIAADSALSAWEFLATAVPDIIVCDILMPDVDGYEFYSQVRQEARLYEVPFIFLTALTEPENVHRGKATGCDDYLTKPFEPDELLAVLNGKLTLSRHRKLMNAVSLRDYNRRIIQTLSHEFRTPLVSINTGTELLLDQLDNLDRKHIERLIQSIRRGGQRLERLVNDFMLVQRIDLGHEEAMAKQYRAKISLVKIVETAIECYGEVFCDSPANLVLVKACDESSPPIVDVYDVQIVNLIQRLLSNAAKFSPRGADVRVTISQSRSYATVSILDQGPGLGGAADSAFEVFGQIGREKLEQQGCGLGLSIAQHFASINNAVLALLTPPNKVGLEARVRFPLAE